MEFGLALTILGLLLGGVQAWPVIRGWLPEKRKALETSLKPEPALDTSELVVGVYPYPPLLLGSDPELMVGPWVELAARIAEALHKRLVLRWFTMGDLTSSEANSIDIAVGIFRTDRRSMKFEFTRPIHRIGLQGVCAANHPAIKSDALSTGRMKVVVQSGEVGWEYVLDEMSNSMQSKRVVVIDTAHSIDILELLTSGIVELALIDELTCINYLRGDGAEKPLRLAFDRPLKIFDACFAVNKSSGIDMQKLNRIIVDARNTPEFLEYEVKALEGYEGIITRAGLR